MRFSTKVERNVVKSFIQKDKTITCPVKAEYYALIDSVILSALCVVDNGDSYHIQGMRTAKENRGRGYATELLRYVLTQYKDKPICADCLMYSKNIFLRLGFTQVEEVVKGNHREWRMRMEAKNGKTKNRD